MFGAELVKLEGVYRRALASLERYSASQTLHRESR